MSCGRLTSLIRHRRLRTEEGVMTKVTAQLAMSLDGFIADPDDRCDELFGFYGSGEVSLKLSEGFPELRVSPVTADLLRGATEKIGATVVGRRLYDITNGWGGHPGGEVPMVVLTHEPPTDWPRDGVPIEFVAGAEAAVARAAELADGKEVSVAGATATREVLDAGLLDEIVVSLVPVILGEGIPWFAGSRGPVRLSDPEVITDAGVTHLRYAVRR
jgi:dihydrofolate reductase